MPFLAKQMGILFIYKFNKFFRSFILYNNGFCYSKFSLWNDIYRNTVDLSAQYLAKAKKLASDNELKAHLVFAQAKNAQQDLEKEGGKYLTSIDDALWEEFERYSQTTYYETVYSNCVYYSDYKN